MCVIFALDVVLSLFLAMMSSASAAYAMASAAASAMYHAPGWLAQVVLALTEKAMTSVCAMIAVAKASNKDRIALFRLRILSEVFGYVAGAAARVPPGVSGSGATLAVRLKRSRSATLEVCVVGGEGGGELGFLLGGASCSSMCVGSSGSESIRSSSRFSCGLKMTRS